MSDRTMDAWVAFTNSDCTEGRGFDIPIAVCETEATAIRCAKKAYVQGSDGPVRKVTLTYSGGYWNGPIKLVSPTPDDLRAQISIDAKRVALEKAKAAGLTDDDIRALTTR